MSYIMIPIKIYHDITEELEDVIVSLVNIHPNFIRNLEECKDDNGTGRINYLNGDCIDTDVNFLELTQMLGHTTNITFPIHPTCAYHSDTLKEYLKYLDEKPNNTIDNGGDSV